MQLSASSSASRAAAVLLASATLVLTGLQAPAGATVLEGADPCFDPATHDLPPAAASARGGEGLDHRPITAAEQARIEVRTHRILAAQRAAGGQKRIRVPVRVHVMAAKNGAGNVSKGKIRRQVRVMNDHFAGVESEAAARTKFRFVLKSIDRYENDRWHRDEQSRKYRSKTRIGGSQTLNMWLVDFDYLGIATFPSDYQGRPRVDGVRVNYTSLPGGSQANYDEGKTATHEVGHWLGLYHTFQNGCLGQGDGVSDTPAEETANLMENGEPCPEDRDTCPAREGLDPVENYMDYSFDACMNQFTPGQKTRMRQMWRAYRG